MNLLKVLLLLIIPFQVHGYDDSPGCFVEIQNSFFQQDSVLQAFNLYRVPTNQMNSLYNELKYRARDVNYIVTQRARRMKPNPLENPFNAEESKSLFLSVLFEIFNETMQINNITNDRDIRQMFEYILEKREGYLNSCLQLDEKKD